MAWTLWPIDYRTNAQSLELWEELVRELNARRSVVGLGSWNSSELVEGGDGWFRVSTFETLTNVIAETAAQYVRVDGLMDGSLGNYTESTLLADIGYGSDWRVLTSGMADAAWLNQLYAAVNALRWTTADVAIVGGTAATRGESEAATLAASHAAWLASPLDVGTFYFSAVYAGAGVVDPAKYLFDADYCDVTGSVPDVAGTTHVSDLYARATTSPYGGTYGGILGCVEGEWTRIDSDVAGTTPVSSVLNIDYADGPAPEGTSFGLRTNLNGGPDAMWIVKWTFL